ncbi:MAG: ThuA domain-containing protein [Planctomycetia bacterium]|nr:ThuA domain-containing protein [Planctomycetia bacterium]
MQRRDFIKGIGISTGLCLSGMTTWGWANEKKGKILYFDLSTEWEHPPTVDEEDGTSKAAKIVQKLGKSIGYDVDVTKDGSIFERDLSQYAAFVFYTCGDLDVKVENRTPVSQKGLTNLLTAIRSGTGFLGIHSATDTWQCKGPLFENQPEDERTEYIKMIGGDFITHGEMQEATQSFTEPIQLPYLSSLKTKNLRVFDEWYCMKNFNKDMHVLIVQETKDMKNQDHNACYNRPSFPSTWVRMEQKGRVAYTAVGHDNERWETDYVQNIVKDLMSFVTGNLDLDMTPNMDQVCPQADVLQY